MNQFLKESAKEINSDKEINVEESAYQGGNVFSDGDESYLDASKVDDDR